MVLDKIIVGAGFYGLYSALYCARRDERVLVLECEPEPFMRASYINQARVHQGYHYPRSVSTAMKSAGYFERFNRDYDFCINREFQKIYGMSKQYSWTDGSQFQKFCMAAGIPCEEIQADKFFHPNMCDSAFQTREYTYDAMILKRYLLEELSHCSNVTIRCGVHINAIWKEADRYVITTESGEKYSTAFLLNVTYASSNQILSMMQFEPFQMKYELCEIILCEVNELLNQYGITVMDGPFFSIMPFGKTGLHSLTSVTFTPHETSYEKEPMFGCQEKSRGTCTWKHLGNCNTCISKPNSAFGFMNNLALKYLHEKYQFRYHSSLFSMKPILKSSEIDDSRPTVIQVLSKNPTCVAVLSGKINTVYDLDEVLSNGK